MIKRLGSGAPGVAGVAFLFTVEHGQAGARHPFVFVRPPAACRALETPATTNGTARPPIRCRSASHPRSASVSLATMCFISTISGNSSPLESSVDHCRPRGSSP